MIIREMTKDNLSDVLKIERKSFTHPWSENAFLSELEKADSYCFVALTDDEIIGYAVMSTVLDEGDLLIIAVDENHRRQGVAKELFGQLLEVAYKKSLSFITLEVRASNHSATALYLSLGFEKVAVRKDYYNQPKEDAVLMTKYLK